MTSAYEVVYMLVSVDIHGVVQSLLGTCFPIAASGVFLTAAHNFYLFEEYKHEFEKDPIFRRKNLEINQSKMRVAVLKMPDVSTNPFHPIKELVEQVIIFTTDDVAVILVQNLKFEVGKCFPIQESVSLGQKVFAIGYGNNGTEISFLPNTPKKRIDAVLSKSHGSVLNLYPNGRDKTLAWYPCFESSCEILSGQSGGPVIDESTCSVVGINSRSMFGSSSLISWLGKVLDEKLSTGWTFTHPETGNKIPWIDLSLRDLSRFGIVFIN